jgi:ADP-ribose pyrophosphatase YjhB (NUDIX family)
MRPALSSRTVSDPITPPEPAAAPGLGAPRAGETHPLIFSTTVCAIVEHGGELLMVRQLNREGEPRWNFPTGWMAARDEDENLQLPEQVVNRNLLMETGYAASQATLIGVVLVREHDDDGRRIGTSTRLDYLCGQPRQTSYAVNDPDILAAPEWFTPDEVEGLIERDEVKGHLTVTAFRHWQEYRRSGKMSADVVDIPN